MKNCPTCKIALKKRNYQRHVQTCRTVVADPGQGGGGKDRVKKIGGDRKKTMPKAIVPGMVRPGVSPQILESVDRQAGQIIHSMKTSGKRRDRR